VQQGPLTLKSHWDGILNGFDSALSNGSVEAINGLIQAAKATARGYRKPRINAHGLPDRSQAQPPASITLHHNIWGHHQLTEKQSTHTNRQIARKCLGFKTPNQLFLGPKQHVALAS
jgi:hypothetical protein